MKKIIALLSLTISGLSFCQDDSKLSLGIQYAPEIAYRTSSSNFHDQEILYGFSSGVTIQFQATDRLTFQTGASYAEGGYSSGPMIFMDNFGNTLGEAEMLFRSRHIQVPLNVMFHFKNSGPHFYAGAGIIPGYVADVEYKTRGNFPGEENFYTESHSKENINPFSLNATGFAGLSLPVGERSSFCIEPGFRYGLIGVTKTTQFIEYHLWNAGINFRYEIKL